MPLSETLEYDSQPISAGQCLSVGNIGIVPGVEENEGSYIVTATLTNGSTRNSVEVEYVDLTLYDEENQYTVSIDTQGTTLSTSESTTITGMTEDALSEVTRFDIDTIQYTAVPRTNSFNDTYTDNGCTVSNLSMEEGDPLDDNTVVTLKVANTTSDPVYVDHVTITITIEGEPEDFDIVANEEIAANDDTELSDVISGIMPLYATAFTDAEVVLGENPDE